MKVFIALLFAVSQLFASALGTYDGFCVYGGRSQTAAKHSHIVFGLYPTVPNCDMINNFPGYFGMDDISKNKGVACDGDGCPHMLGKDPQHIDRVELNVEFGHYTWYKDRDNNLVDLGDRVVGKCFEQHESFTSHEIHCVEPTTKGDHKVDLNPYLWCDTKVWKA